MQINPVNLVNLVKKHVNYFGEIRSDSFLLINCKIDCFEFCNFVKTKISGLFIPKLKIELKIFVFKNI